MEKAKMKKIQRSSSELTREQHRIKFYMMVMYKDVYMRKKQHEIFSL